MATTLGLHLFAGFQTGAAADNNHVALASGRK